MSLLRTNFYGDPNLGLHGFATDSYCFLGVNVKKAKKALNVPVHTLKIMNTDLAGIFVTGNSSGIIMPRLDDHEMKKIEKNFKNVLTLKSRYTAFGNLVLMNDNGIIISPLLRKHRKEIADFFNIRCEVSRLAGLRVIGSSAIATNKGCLAHPKIKDSEKELIGKVLKVPVHIGTSNYGTPYVKSGIVANSFGVIVSEQSTGHELGRITEALGFI